MDKQPHPAADMAALVRIFSRAYTDHRKGSPRRVGATNAGVCAIVQYLVEQDALAPSGVERSGGEAVTVETVGFVREDDAGDRYIDWIVEGGIHGVELGCELITSDVKITDDTGAGEVYTHQAVPPAPADVARDPVEVLRIAGTPHLDPITIYVEDIHPGAGRATIACYNESWTCFWGAMGDRTLLQFVASCDRHYIAGNMLTGRNRPTKHEQKYAERIAQAFIDAAMAAQRGEAHHG